MNRISVKTHSEKNPAWDSGKIQEGFTLIVERARLGCRAFQAEQTLSLKRSAAEGLSRGTPSVRVRLRPLSYIVT